MSTPMSVDEAKEILREAKPHKIYKECLQCYRVVETYWVGDDPTEGEPEPGWWPLNLCADCVTGLAAPITHLAEALRVVEEAGE